MMMRNLLFMIITILLPPHDDDKKPPLGKGARQAQPLLPSALLPRWICDKNVGHWEKRRLWGWQQFMMHLIFYPSAFRSNTLKTSLIFSFAFILKWEYVTDLYVNLKQRAQQIQPYSGHLLAIMWRNSSNSMVPFWSWNYDMATWAVTIICCFFSTKKWAKKCINREVKFVPQRKFLIWKCFVSF